MQKIRPIYADKICQCYVVPGILLIMVKMFHKWHILYHQRIDNMSIYSMYES